MELKLIKAVRLHPCLYDKKRKNYRQKLEKEKAWLAVEAAVGVKRDLCQKRWRTLRDRFVRECGEKLKPGKKCSTWKYFKQLSFLKSHMKHRQKMTNTVSTPSSASSDDICSSESSHHSNTPEPPCTPEEEVKPEPSYTPEVIWTPCPLSSTVDFVKDSSDASTSRPAKKKKRLSKEREKFDDLVEALQAYIEKKSRQETKSRNEDFLKVLDSYLLKLPEYQQDVTKVEILQLVLEKQKKRSHK